MFVPATCLVFRFDKACCWSLEYSIFFCQMSPSVLAGQQGQFGESTNNNFVSFYRYVFDCSCGSVYRHVPIFCLIFI